MMTDWTFPLCPEPPDWLLHWDEMLVNYDWLNTLRGCPQEPAFHNEGDVLTHTRLVVEALIADPRWRALDTTTRSELFLAALLHDIGKPATTQRIQGKIATPDHANRGAKMAQAILYHQWPDEDPPVPFAVRQSIVGLVRHHGLPVWFLNRKDAEQNILAASLRVRLDRLSLLAEMDVRGRIAPDVADLLAQVDLFREQTQLLGCLTGPYAFPSDHTLFTYFNTRGRSPAVEAYDDTRFEVVMMSGLPGAGKDTWVETNLSGWSVISLDKLRVQLGVKPEDEQGTVVMKAKELAREYLRQTQPFVWNATNITRRIRSGLIDLFTAYHASVRIVYCEAAWADLLRRNGARHKPVPEAVIRRLADRLEVPDRTEAHVVSRVVI